MKQVFRTGVAAVLAVAALSGAAMAADEKPGDKPAAEDKAEIKLPPLPVDKSVKQSIVVAGKTLAYTATVGSLPVRFTATVVSPWAGT